MKESITKLEKTSTFKRLKGIKWYYSATVIGIAFVIVVGIIYIFNKPAIVEAGWFNDGWAYRQTVSITNGGTAQTNFQVKITLDSAALITAGKVQSDCDDIRITDISGNILPHWIEDSTCSTSVTHIWTKVPSISTSGAIVYLYYGNTSASNIENGDSVFEFFDDFSGDLNKWVNDGNWIISNGRAKHNKTSGTWDYLKADIGIADGVIESSLGNIQDDGSTHHELGIFVRALNTIDGLNIQNIIRIEDSDLFYNDYSETLRPAIVTAYSTYYRQNISLNGQDVIIKWDDIVKVTDTTTHAVETLIGFRAVQSESYVDWIFVRKYAATEPVIGTPSSEEKGPGPIAYWKFDEGYGTTTQDSTTNNNDGTIAGATWQTEDMCISGKCLYFDGSGDYIVIGDIGSVTEATFSFWFKSTSASQSASFISNVNGLGLGRLTIELQSGTLRVGHFSAGSDYNNVFTPSINTWYYVSVVHTATQIEAFVDGVSKGTVNSTYSSGTLNIDVGRRSASSYEFTGFIDEPKIYNYARTAAQIKADYLAGQVGSSSGVGASFGGGQQNKSEGLVGYWKMDETPVEDSAVTTDYSGNGNTGITNSVTAAWVTGDLVVGKYGNGYSFNGSTDGRAVTIADDSTIKPTVSITTELWFKTTDKTATAQRMLSKTEGSGYQLSLNENSACPSTTLCFLAHIDGGYRSASYASSNINNNQWYHMAGTFDGNEGILYLDGIEVGTFTHSGTISTSTVPLCIGSEAGSSCNSGFYKGTIDEVKIYNVARTADQIMRDYKTGPGPVAYYNFEEQSISIAYDRSGSGINLTATGFDSTNIGLGKFGSAYKYKTWIERHTGTVATICNTITMEAWIYPLSLPAERYTIIFQSGTSAAYLSYYLDGSVHTYWANKTSNGYHTSGAGTVPINEWSHVAAVWDDLGANVYVNGVLKNFVPSSGTSCTGTNLTLGAESGGRQMDGYIDEVKIYNYARTQEQILWDMYGDESPHPILYYTFNEGYGTTPQDSSGNNEDINSWVNSPTWTTGGKFGNAINLLANGAQVKNTVFNYDIMKAGKEDKSWTFSIWTKPVSQPDYQEKIIFGRQGHHGGILANQNDFEFQLRNNVPATDVSIIKPISSWNEWYYLVATYDNRNAKFYVNGDYVGSGYMDGTFYLYNDIIWIGFNNPYDFNGIVDEAKIFNFALSQEQIRQEYNQGSQVSLGKQKDSSETWDAGGFGGSAPIFWFDMEEGTGSVLHSKGSSSATSSTWDGTPTWTLGKPGWALDFNGSTDGVYIPGVATYAHETMTAWVYIDSTETNGDIVGNAHTNSNAFGFTFYIDNNTVRAKAEQNGDTYFYTNVTADITNLKNRWIHLGMSWDNLGTGLGGCDATVKLYVNGDMVDSATHNVSAGSYNCTYPYAYPFSIGGTTETSLTRTTKVKIDEVKIYDYVRTPAQIAYDYNGGKPVGWWRLNDGEGIIALDSSGNDNHGTLYGLDNADWVDAKHGYGINFDGTGEGNTADNIDVIKVSDNDALDVDISNAYSFTTWVYNDSSVCAVYGKKNGQWEVYRCSSVVTSRINNPVALSHAGSTALNNGQWYHVATTYDSVTSELHLYIDGVEESGFPKTGISGTPSSTSEDIGIGAYNSGAYSTNGTLDDVRIYNYALTDKQVKEVMNYGSVYIK